MKKTANKKDNYNLEILRALIYFLENPYKEVYLREFSRKLKISPNTAQRFLNLFLKENLLIESKKANLRYFKANLENPVFRHIKITYSLKKLENSGLIKVLEEISSHILIFGSIAEGKDDEKSDIDLLVISQNRLKIKEKILDFQTKISREISPHVFSWQEWKKQAKLNKAFYQDIIIKGINLVGEKPVVE